MVITRRKICLLLFMALSIGTMLADNISEEQAIQIASQFINSSNRVRGRSKALPNLQIAYISTVKSSTPEMYVINKGEKEGFVIVAGDDCAGPIVLGYSDNGSFDYDKVHPGLKNLLSQYAGELNHCRKTGYVNAMISRNVENFGHDVVAPLLQTHWNQTSPYWNQTPDKSYTGCVPTAMAQIMKYWEWPKKGYGTHNNDRYPIQSVNFSVSEYDWDNMANEYGAQSTDEQINAVAKLMADVGCAVNVYYTNNGNSSAYMIDACKALVSNFGYSQDARYLYSVWDYGTYKSNETMEALIREELDNHRPVLYAATDVIVEENYRGGAHAFVCDGYTDEGYFHLNFGWSGNCDGYYLLKVMSSAANYWFEPEVIIGIHPSDKERVCVDNIYYELSGDEATAVACNDETFGETRNFVVPTAIDAGGKTYNVTGIWNGTFANALATSITIQGIKKIPDRLFYNDRRLKKFIFDDEVEEIGKLSFHACTNLTDVTLGKNVKKIDDEAFSLSTGLTNITFNDGLEEIGRQAFQGCTNLKELTLSPSLKNLGTEAFMKCSGLTKVAFNDGLEEISDSAFFDCNNITEISIGTGLKKIGDAVFFNCYSLTDVQNTDMSVLEHIGDSAFIHCSKLGYLYLPASLKYIGKEAFSHCSELHITIDNKATDFIIDKDANVIDGWPGISNAKEIRTGGVRINSGSFTVSPKTIYETGAVRGHMWTINLPADLETFDVTSVSGTEAYMVEDGNKNFSSHGGVLYNKDMTTLLAYPSWGDNTYIIPAFVKHIGKDAGLPINYTLPPSIREIPASELGLHNITVLSNTPPTVTSLEGSIYAPGYEYSAENYTLTVPYGSTETYSKADGWKEYVNIKEGELLVDDKYCYQIYEKYEYVEVIGRNGNAEFNGIVDDIPTSVTFKDKTYDVTQINRLAFRGDIELKSITLGGSISGWGGWHDALNNCSNLESITIGKQFSDMGQRSLEITFFEGCPKLAEFIVEEGNKDFFVEDGILYCDRFRGEWWDGTVEALKCPPMRKDGDKIAPREEAVISSRCIAINYSAFSGELKSLTIPASVETIRDNAFAGCTKLETVTNLATIPQNISSETFEGIRTRTTGFDYIFAATLRVPRGSKTAYEEHWVWKNFQAIEEIEEAFDKEDVDQNGTVNAADITAILYFIAGNSTISKDTADVNGDGLVNVADIIAVANKIMIRE